MWVSEIIGLACSIGFVCFVGLERELTYRRTHDRETHRLNAPFHCRLFGNQTVFGWQSNFLIIRAQPVVHGNQVVAATDMNAAEAVAALLALSIIIIIIVEHHIVARKPHGQTAQIVVLMRLLIAEFEFLIKVTSK